MRGLVRFTAAAIVLLTMSGCSLFHRHIAAPFEAAQPATTITGSQDGDGGNTVYLVAVDGKFMDLGAGDWANKTPLDAGTHEIKFGILKSDAAVGFATVTTSLRPGNDYVLRASVPKVVSPQCSTSLAWLETADGHLASAQVSVTIPASVEAETTLPDGGYRHSWSPANCSGA